MTILCLLRYTCPSLFLIQEYLVTSCYWEDMQVWGEISIFSTSWCHCPRGRRERIQSPLFQISVSWGSLLQEFSSHLIYVYNPGFTFSLSCHWITMANSYLPFLICSSLSALQWRSGWLLFYSKECEVQRGKIALTLSSYSFWPLCCTWMEVSTRKSSEAVCPPYQRKWGERLLTPSLLLIRSSRLTCCKLWSFWRQVRLHVVLINFQIKGMLKKVNMFKRATGPLGILPLLYFS